MGQPLNVNLKHIIQVVHLGGKNGLTRGGPLGSGKVVLKKEEVVA